MLYCNYFCFLSVQIANQIQRHAVLHSSKKFVTDPANLQALRDLVNKPGAREEFNFAQANPESDAAKALYRKLKAFIRLGGAHVPFSAIERSQGVSKMYYDFSVFFSLTFSSYFIDFTNLLVLAGILSRINMGLLAHFSLGQWYRITQMYLNSSCRLVAFHTICYRLKNNASGRRAQYSRY